MSEIEKKRKATSALADGMVSGGLRRSGLASGVMAAVRADTQNGQPDQPSRTTQAGLQEIVDVAVAIERERCIQICLYHDKDCAATGRPHDATEIADAIRRKNE